MAGAAESRKMKLLAHCDLDGAGKGGEGIGLHTRNGRRILFVAHETAPKNFSAVDVTDPRHPKVVLQTALPHADVRSNSLCVLGDLLAVAYQTTEPGLTPAGVEFFDLADPTAPRSIGFFDASGPHSRGAHFVWLGLDGFAYISTGLRDWEPKRRKDYQLVAIVDVRYPSRPVETGRWWLPGTMKGDATTVPTQPDPQNDSGYRAHNINVYPGRPDRAYVGYLDGGVVILDITDRARPTMVSHFDYHPPMKSGFTHTIVPLFERGLLLVADEAWKRPESLPPIEGGSGGWDHPKPVWIMDGSHESVLMPLSTLPMPPVADFRARGGKFGAHTIHENDPVPASWQSQELVFGTFFNAGVRAYDIRDPFRPEEVGYYIPEAPRGSKIGAPQINDVYVDERRTIYATERTTGGLYILELAT